MDNITNQENKLLYENLKQQHLNEGGKHPDSYAMTEVIKQAIINKTYKVYSGGGYESKTENRIKNYDVVAWFNFGGDAFFQMCVDNSEGDCCVLQNSNQFCNIMEKIF